MWGSFPTNSGGFQLLKEYMAEKIGITDGCAVAFGKGLHLYEYWWDQAKLVLHMPLE